MRAFLCRLLLKGKEVLKGMQGNQQRVWGEKGRAFFVEVFQLTAPCFYSYSASNDSPDVLPSPWFRCSASVTMKEKRAVRWVCGRFCVCVRAGLALRVVREFWFLYICTSSVLCLVSTWNHRVTDTLSLPNINFRSWPNTQTYTPTHTVAKGMSCLGPQFVGIVYYTRCYPVDTIVLLLFSLKEHLTKKK